MVQHLSDLPGIKLPSPPFSSQEAPVAWDVAAPSEPLDVLRRRVAMTGRQVEPHRTRTALREEAQSLLDVAIRSRASAARKHLLLGSFELIQRAEMMSEPPEAPSLEVPLG
jgi:hypothetical protein